MRNINVYIPSDTFKYIMRNSTTREIDSNSPKYVLYYRHRNGSLGHVVISLSVLWVAASDCKFDSYKLKEEFFSKFFPSLKNGLIEEKVNYLWRTYNWHTI